jgi:hypothetical protein
MQNNLGRGLAPPSAGLKNVGALFEKMFGALPSLSPEIKSKEWHETWSYEPYSVQRLSIVSYWLLTSFSRCCELFLLNSYFYQILVLQYGILTKIFCHVWGSLMCGNPCSAEPVRTLVNPALPLPRPQTLATCGGLSSDVPMFLS